jgi:hypothetical protein
MPKRIKNNNVRDTKDEEESKEPLIKKKHQQHQQQKQKQARTAKAKALVGKSKDDLNINSIREWWWK